MAQTEIDVESVRIAAEQAAASARAAADAAQAATATSASQGGQQTDVGAGYRSSGAEVTSDIGQAEAYMLNMKRLVAMELNRDSASQNMVQRRERNGEDHDQNLRQLTVQLMQGAVSLQGRVNNLAISHDGRIRAFQEGEVARTVRNSDLAIDRQWNVDEVAELVAKTPVFLDAIAGAVAAGVAKAMTVEKPAS